MGTHQKIGVLFVCLGNICRSPAGEGAFLHLIKKRGLDPYFDVDSSGTSAYHIGEPANNTMQKVAKQDGVHLPSRARQFQQRDFQRFHYILAMDRSNYQDILAQAKSKADEERVFLFRQFDPEVESNEVPGVPDPYYGGIDGFRNVQTMVMRTAHCLLDEIIERYNLKNK